MIFGWVPKLNIPNITPFSFDHYTVDNLIEDIQHNINEPKIIYKGQRFSNSLALH